MEFYSDAHKEAYEAVKNLLPSEEIFEKETRWLTNKPGVPIVGNESQIYAYLYGEHNHDHNSLQSYLIYRRSFLGSCSSSWSYGTERFPAYPDELLEYVCSNGPCDIFEEVSHDTLRKALMLATERMKTGIPQSSGSYPFIIIDMYNSYIDGYGIVPEFFIRLDKFRKFTGNYNLNQAGYTVIDKHDDHAILIIDQEPNNYDNYLAEKLRELHKITPICIGASHGPLYYYTKNDIYSPAINRLWLLMRNISSGTIIYDLDSGQVALDRIGLGGSRKLN